MSYAISTTVSTPYAETVEAVKAALGEQGFGVLTEIDIKATLKKKLDVDVPAQVILGACRPPLAHQALQAEPSVGLLFPATSWSVRPGRVPSSRRWTPRPWST